MIFEFCNLSLDIERRELRSSDGALKLQPRLFDLLLYLIRNRERVVTKEELLEKLWPNVIVEEGALQRAVSVTRSTLRAACGKECIRTYPRQGYRFISEVTEQASRGVAPSSAKPSIVVLPFACLSCDSDQAFFAEGIAEDISTALSRLRYLFVISRASGMAYRELATDVAEIGRELSVRYVLSGSVRTNADRIRVSVSLMDTSTRGLIWADRFDRQLGDLFTVQDEITAAIVATIEPEFSHFEASRAGGAPPESLDAWTAYQKGLWHLYQFTQQGIQQSLPLFERARSLDPRFAPVHAGISFTHFANAYLGYGKVRPDEIRMARLSAEEGVGVDNHCPFAHWALGRALLLTGNLEGAIEEIETSLSLNPNFAHGYYMLGWAQVLNGDAIAALSNLDKAEQLSPLDPLMFAFNMVRSMAHLHLKENALALEYADKACKQPKAHAHALAIRVVVLMENAMLDDARVVAQTLLSRRPDYTCSLFECNMPYRSSTERAQMCKQLALAGIPVK
ncbi:MAG: winged helix-turn-helix domain-containing protein [Oceanospirillaceae bacterium]|nr:winged helix-turn-helix domain-containing protein [Oceanospirillaceae bacterium]